MSSYLSGDNDTICALATPHGIGGISVIRISGPKTIEIIRKIAFFLPKKIESHKVYFSALKKGSQSNHFIDEGLVTFFLGDRSYTGETASEISCHGNPIIVREIVNFLLEHGARLAQPGEFTYRAFINGKIDLVQAESVLSLIESQSKRSQQQSLQQLRGKLSQDLDQIADDLIYVLSVLEANIDFTTEDIGDLPVQDMLKRLKKRLLMVDVFINSYRAGKVLKEGYQVIIVGRPNVGKSSLLNALTEKDKAIVSHLPGTTRDLIEEHAVIEGVCVKLIDTAGLRKTKGVVEKIGVERAKQAILDADLLIVVTDATLKSSKTILHEDQRILKDLPSTPLIKVRSKKDLVKNHDFLPNGEIHISNKTGEGIENLKNAIGERLQGYFEGQSLVIMQARQFECLKMLQESLQKSIELLEKDESLELIALELQIGLKSLFRLLGKEFNDEVMDRVFKEFCIGK